jgi:hypothetical protein
MAILDGIRAMLRMFPSRIDGKVSCAAQEIFVEGKL